MKKYISGFLSVLFLAILVIPSFSFAQRTSLGGIRSSNNNTTTTGSSTNPGSSVPGDIDPNTDTSQCLSLVNNLRYKDRDANKNGEVSTLQDFLQVKGYLNSEPTGYFGLMTQKAVKSFQSANGISPTGYVGAITRANIQASTCGDIVPPIITSSITVLSPNGGESYKIGDKLDFKWKSSGLSNKKMIIMLNSVDINHNYGTNLDVNDASTGFVSWVVESSIPVGRYKVCMSSTGTNINGSIVADDCSDNYFTITSPTTSGPTISGISGPQTLNVGQQGTWTVNAYDNSIPGSSGNLSYSVVWGDARVAVDCSAGAPCSSVPTAPLQQSATFTHTYSTAGNYTPTFYVTNGNGKTAQTSLSVKVGESSISDFYINIIGGQKSSYSPGEKISLSFYGKETDGTYTTQGEGFYSQIYVNDSGNTKQYAGENAIYDSSTNKWNVSFTAPTDITKTYILLLYLYCGTDSSLCVSKYGEHSQRIKTFNFSLVSVTTTPTISGISGPQTLNVGQQGTWTVNAYDNSIPGSSGNLSYSVSWGDLHKTTCTTGTTIETSGCKTESVTQSQQSATFTHTYSTAGTYNTIFTVTNSIGKTATDYKTISVNSIPAPVIDIYANPTTVVSGGISTIYWSSKNTTSCTGSEGTDGWAKTKAASVYVNSQNVKVFIPTIFKITCVGTNGTSVSNSVTVGVNDAYQEDGIIQQSSNALSAFDSLNSSTKKEKTNNSPVLVNSELSCQINSILSKGMDSGEVKCLQQILNKKGFKVEGTEGGKEITFFGYNTLIAVKNFQASVGLTKDGIVGAATRTFLLE